MAQRCRVVEELLRVRWGKDSESCCTRVWSLSNDVVVVFLSVVGETWLIDGARDANGLCPARKHVRGSVESALVSAGKCKLYTRVWSAWSMKRV